MKGTAVTRNRRGFTALELVIVIVVIAVLAAVLIPTISSVIRSVRHSNDVATVKNINQVLLIDDPGARPADYEKAKSVMGHGGYEIPCKPEEDGYAFYWMPEEDRVVLYDLTREQVDFPKEYQKKEKSGDWINLAGEEEPVPPESSVSSEESVSSEPATSSEESASSEPTPSEPEETQTYVLLSGSQFNGQIKELCAAPTRIVFGNTADYADKTAGKSVAVSSDGNIKAYLSGTEVYVLASGKIKTATSAASMFSGMDKLIALSLGALDTGDATGMSKMFYGCSALTELDLSSFNTAKVTNMQNMFNGCKNLEKILVVTGAQHWNTGAVSSSDDMFANCDKLVGWWSLLHEIFPDWNWDKTWAHTGWNGLLTEKAA